MRNTFFISACFLLLILGCSSPKLMSYQEFSMVKELKLPQILNLKSSEKEILYFGTYHSNSISDSLFLRIKKEFKEFQPNFVLHEGGNDWPIYKNKDSTVLISGEPGYIIQLSQDNKIKYSTIEPKAKDEYEYLLKRYSLEYVVLMYMCRQIDNQQRLAIQHNTTDIQFIHNMNYFFRMLANDGIPINGEKLEFLYWKNVYKKLLKEELVWRKFNPELYYPNKYLTKLNEINRVSDEFRNSYMVEKILSTSDKFDKLMVLLGGGHLIMQQNLLEYKFNKKYK